MAIWKPFPRCKVCGFPPGFPCPICDRPLHLRLEKGGCTTPCFERHLREAHRLFDFSPRRLVA